MVARITGLVSIVVTNYNKGPFLEQCLDSLLKQTYADWEIVWVDDCSTDDSGARLDRWLRDRGMEGREDRFCLLRLPRNVGYPGAVTAGLYLAKGEFIAMQDADDVSHPERLARQVACMRSRPKLELLGANYAVFKEIDELTDPDKLQKARWLRYGSEAIRKVYAAGGHCVSHGTAMLRGALFDRIGGQTRRIEGAEDYEFIARSLNPGADNVDNLPDVLYYYRRHPDQRSRLYFGKGKANPGHG